MDKRGNRTQVQETLAHPTTTFTTTIAHNDKGLLLKGSWSAVSGFRETTQTEAALALIFLGDEATLTMGTGPDHGMYDVYLDGSLWQSFDGYASAAGSRAIVISSGIDSRKLGGEGPHLLEIRSRIERNKQNVTAPPVYKLRFQQLTVNSRTWTQQTIRYSYDRLARLKEARYNPGVNTAAVDADLLRRYLYTFDLYS